MNGIDPGTYDVVVERCTPVQMKTSRIGFTSFDVSAPITGGSLTVREGSSQLRVELALDELRTSNPLMQVAARSLVASGNGETLVFDAAGDHQGARTDGTLTFAGDAKAGDVEVPMTIDVSVGADDEGLLLLALIGTAEFNDVHIPLPGLSGVRTIGADLQATLAVAAG